MREARGARAPGCLCRAARCRRGARPATSACRSSKLLLVVLRSALVVLRCALDRRYPALAPLHPDLVFRLQLEGRLIQTSDPDLDERLVGVGWVKGPRPAGVGCAKEPRPAAGAKAAAVIT